ncbi:MAG: ABC transporter permease [Candidatus Hydrogenedentes bacterium]|nr:ABC transporter permease [Candidatus Hydrogenedentota bacterium]
MAREMRRAVSRPLYCLLTIVLPLVAFGLIVFLFKAGKASDLPIAVCDKDFSSLSRKLVRLLDATQTMKVAYRVTDIEEGKSLIASGKVYALVVIPEHMERDVYAARAPRIVGYYNNQYLLPAGLVSRDMLTVVATVSAGINVKTRQKKGEPLVMAMEHVSPVSVDTHTLFNPSANNAYYLVPYFLPNMIQVFVLLTTVFVLGIELREGTGRELLERAGGSIVSAIAGKLLPYTLVFFVLGNISNFLLFSYMDVPVHGSMHTRALASSSSPCCRISAWR